MFKADFKFTKDELTLINSEFQKTHTGMRTENTNGFYTHLYSLAHDKVQAFFNSIPTNEWFWLRSGVIRGFRDFNLNRNKVDGRHLNAHHICHEITSGLYNDRNISYFSNFCKSKDSYGFFSKHQKRFTNFNSYWRNRLGDGAPSGYQGWYENTPNWFRYEAGEYSPELKYRKYRWAWFKEYWEVQYYNHFSMNEAVKNQENAWYFYFRYLLRDYRQKHMEFFKKFLNQTYTDEDYKADTRYMMELAHYFNDAIQVLEHINPDGYQENPYVKMYAKLYEYYGFEKLLKDSEVFSNYFYIEEATYPKYVGEYYRRLTKYELKNEYVYPQDLIEYHIIKRFEERLEIFRKEADVLSVDDLNLDMNLDNLVDNYASEDEEPAIVIPSADANSTDQHIKEFHVELDKIKEDIKTLYDELANIPENDDNQLEALETKRDEIMEQYKKLWNMDKTGEDGVWNIYDMYALSYYDFKTFKDKHKNLPLQEILDNFKNVDNIIRYNNEKFFSSLLPRIENLKTTFLRPRKRLEHKDIFDQLYVDGVDIFRNFYRKIDKELDVIMNKHINRDNKTEILDELTELLNKLREEEYIHIEKTPVNLENVKPGTTIYEPDVDVKKLREELEIKFLRAIRVLHKGAIFLENQSINTTPEQLPTQQPTLPQPESIVGLPQLPQPESIVGLPQLPQLPQNIVATPPQTKDIAVAPLTDEEINELSKYVKRIPNIISALTDKGIHLFPKDHILRIHPAIERVKVVVTRDGFDIDENTTTEDAVKQWYSIIK